MWFAPVKRSEDAGSHFDILVTLTPLLFRKMMREEQDKIGLRNHLHQLMRFQIIFRLDGPRLSALRMCDSKDCLATLCSQLHVPRKIMSLFGPTYVTGIEIVAKRKNKLDYKVSCQQTNC